MYLFFSHQLTSSQYQEAKEKWGVEEFVSLPPHLQKLFSEVPPEIEDLSEYIRPFISFILETYKKEDLILLQGEYGIVYKLVNISKSIGIIPIYSTTVRKIVEKKVKGKVVKVSEFSHVLFRRY